MTGNGVGGSGETVINEFIKGGGVSVCTRGCDQGNLSRSS